MITKSLFITWITCTVILGLPAQHSIAETAKFKYSTDIPASVTTPDSVKTRLGTLNFFDGMPDEKTVKSFWSFMVYDSQTRSMLQTDQRSPGIDSKKADLVLNSEGSATLYFGPKAPKGHETNWVQTLPGKSFNVMYRMYSPLEPWFDKSWKLGDFELIE